MTIAVMQPYIFPYLGYYQLVKAVDTFVFFDDVNFINKGWINRNQLLQKDIPFKFTIPLIKASQNRKINEIEIADYIKWRNDFLKQVEFNYKKAPHFQLIYTWLSEVLFLREFKLINDLACTSIEATAKLLDLKTKFTFSSALNYQENDTVGGETKILQICEITGADHYINPINGFELYQHSKFTERQIKLNFISMDEIEYPQFGVNKFVPFLSIIDVLMFNDAEKVNQLLHKYKLI